MDDLLPLRATLCRKRPICKTFRCHPEHYRCNAHQNLEVGDSILVQRFGQIAYSTIRLSTYNCIVIGQIAGSCDDSCDGGSFPGARWTMQQSDSLFAGEHLTSSVPLRFIQMFTYMILMARRQSDLKIFAAKEELVEYWGSRRWQCVM